MNKDDILAKSRAENKAAFMDERERELRLREDSFAFGFMLLLAFVLLIIKFSRGQPAADILTMITGMSAAGFAYRTAKNRKKSDIVFTALCTALTALYFVKFLSGGV
ncbi:MAG: hypothetical protein HFF69_13360 [Oscillospiraceae bacterium]|nr:hypothetical protein [Oscillospiraceae bacterium]